MKQTPVLSKSGMFSRFTASRVIRTVELDYNQILRAFDTLKEGEPHYELSLALVEKTQQKIGNRFKQVNILKAVLVSEKLFNDAKIANAAVEPLIQEMRIVDDFFMPDDRFTKTLAAIAPKQSFKNDRFLVGAGGVTDVGAPYVAATLRSEPLTPASLQANAGTVTYTGGDAGTAVSLSFVTQALHPTLLVTRQKQQAVTPELVINNEVLGVIMSPTLAGLLGIALPSY